MVWICTECGLEQQLFEQEIQYSETVTRYSSGTQILDPEGDLEDIENQETEGYDHEEDFQIDNELSAVRCINCGATATNVSESEYEEMQMTEGTTTKRTTPLKKIADMKKKIGVKR